MRGVGAVGYGEPVNRRRSKVLIRMSGIAIAAATLVAACGTSGGVSIGRSDNLGTAATDQPIDTTGSSTVETADTTDTTGDTTGTTDTTGGTTDTTIPGMMELPTETIPLDGPFPYDANKPPQPFDGLMVATIQDLESWWAEQMPQVFGFDYVALEGGVFPAYPTKTDYPDGCFSTYEEIEGNGFYCPPGDYIAWDDVGYALNGWNNHGSGAIAALMSHEWGHAIQGRTGVFDIVPEVPTPVVELQADCYSGAWYGHIARGESDVLTFTDADIRSGIIDTVLSADPVGYTPSDPGAHGAGFDRVGAFQDGFNLGVQQCSTYVDSPPPITEIGFSDQDLQNENPGNLPYDDIVQVIPDDLNFFWQQTLPDDFSTLRVQAWTDVPAACDSLDAEAVGNSLAVYCAASGAVLINETASQSVVGDFGDFSLGFVLAEAWAEAAQTAVQSSFTGEQRVLYNDCFVGVWAASLPLMSSDQRPAISPGDLDEAVATALLLADDNADDNINGDAFAKIDAFRTGVLGGISGCNDYFS
jgi:predicted metalloprotease